MCLPRPQQAVGVEHPHGIDQVTALCPAAFANRPPACAAEARGITSSDTSDFTRQGIPLAITQSKASAALLAFVHLHLAALLLATVLLAMLPMTACLMWKPSGTVTVAHGLLSRSS